MSDKINIGRTVKDLRKSPSFPPATGVRMLINDSDYVEGGTKTGYVFTFESPWATENQATWLAGKLAGYEYQPYEADTGLLNPAAELGDFINVRGAYGGLFYEEIEFQNYSVSFGASADEEIDHEFQFVSTQDKKLRQKVSRKSPTGNTEFGWSIDDNGWTVHADGNPIFKVSADGAEVEGKITATSGEIGGATIENGVLTVDTVNIKNGAVKTDKIGTGQVTGGVSNGRATGSIAYGTVQNLNTSFPGTLTQVGTNKSNIEAIQGYFTGSANFNRLDANNIWLGGLHLTYGSIKDGNGRTVYNVVFGNST